MTKSSAPSRKQIADELRESYNLGGSVSDHLEGAETALDYLVDFLKRTEPYAKDEIRSLEEASEIMRKHRDDKVFGWP